MKIFVPQNIFWALTGYAQVRTPKTRDAKNIKETSELPSYSITPVGLLLKIISYSILSNFVDPS